MIYDSVSVVFCFGIYVILSQFNTFIINPYIAGRSNFVFRGCTYRFLLVQVQSSVVRVFHAKSIISTVFHVVIHACLVSTLQEAQLQNNINKNVFSPENGVSQNR